MVRIVESGRVVPETKALRIGLVGKSFAEVERKRSTRYSAVGARSPVSLDDSFIVSLKPYAYFNMLLNIPDSLVCISSFSLMRSNLQLSELSKIPVRVLPNMRRVLLMFLSDEPLPAVGAEPKRVMALLVPLRMTER